MEIDRVLNAVARGLTRGLWSLALAALLSAAPARAQTPPDLISPFDAALIESLISPRSLLGEVVTERDLDLFFAHLKASMLAASSGTEPPVPSDELKQRAEAIGKTLRTRGTLAALVLLEALEASARQRLRELQRQRAAPAAATSRGSI